MGSPLKRLRFPPTRTEFARERCTDVSVPILACRGTPEPDLIGVRNDAHLTLREERELGGRLRR
jgi:hypothetical protein